MEWIFFGVMGMIAIIVLNLMINPPNAFVSDFYKDQLDDLEKEKTKKNKEDE